MKAIAFFFLCSLVERATAVLIIDEFTSGGVTLDTVNGEGRNSFVDSAFRNPSPDFNNLTRQLEATYSTRVAIDSETEAFTFLATGSGGNGMSNSAGYFDLFWTFDTPTNLLGANNSAFLINILDIGLMGPASVSFSVNQVSYRGSSSPIRTTTGPLLFSFEDFDEVDFSAVESIGLSTSRQGTGASLTLGSMSVVPEPSVAGLFGLAALFLLRRRRN